MQTTEQKFYVCTHCKKIVGAIHDTEAPMSCCGEPMKELHANTVDASKEKHVPVTHVNGSTVTVEVGGVAHPMIDEHYIEWIYIQTAQGGQRKALHPGQAPRAVFSLSESDEFAAAFAFCNLHGLWKSTEVEG